MIPISKKSYVSATLKVTNQSGCNTKVYLQKKLKNGRSYETVGDAYVIKTSGTRTLTKTWSGILDPTNYDYYIYTYAHKGLFGYSAPSATITIKT
ncbi:MAG: hypothetical protein KAX49_19615 [Halanaerobiales bacterium]|nr:hypothetical protein [Halanaerobiales bacterium]